MCKFLIYFFLRQRVQLCSGATIKGIYIPHTPFSKYFPEVLINKKNPLSPPPSVNLFIGKEHVKYSK